MKITRLRKIVFLFREGKPAKKCDARRAQRAEQPIQDFKKVYKVRKSPSQGRVLLGHTFKLFHTYAGKYRLVFLFTNNYS